MNTTASEAEAAIRAERDAECRMVRAGTLGYQRCYLPVGHAGKHKAQDGKKF